MKKLILGSMVLLSGFGACQEKSTSGTALKKQDQDQKMLDIYKQVKTFNDQPWYELEFSQDACGYEILINDIPLQRYLMFGSVNKQRIPVNDHILATGKQNITIRMFPPQLSDGSWSASLVDASKLAVKVMYRKFDGPMEDFTPVFEFVAPNKAGTAGYLRSGQQFYEFKGSFEAIVPYQLEGWDNSKDLSKENQEELLKEAVLAYNRFRKVLINKEVNVYADLMYDKELDLAKAFYWTKPSDSKARWSEMKGTVLEKREILPLVDFKLVLYAGGKVLALQPVKGMYQDYLSAIHARTADDDIQISFLLHKKRGSNELSPIR
ncbi:hypothetical protein [Pedobacter caeni]|nr:hypothetical protein [Pedobacter caeni]